MAEKLNCQWIGTSAVTRHGMEKIMCMLIREMRDYHNVRKAAASYHAL